MNATLETLAFDTDAGQAVRAALGVIVLKTDETLEHDLRRILPSDGVRVHYTRIDSGPAITPEALAAMASSLTASAAMFPEAVRLSSIGYGCTSASLVIGEDAVCDRIQATQPGVPTTNPYSALKAACETLGIRKLALVSPYTFELTQSLGDGLAAAGLDVVRLCSFGQEEERVVARITPASVMQAYVEAANGECDAVFASCTNLRAADVITEAEAAVGKPVLCSNQVLAWHLMRLAGLDDRVQGFGRLLAEA